MPEIRVSFSHQQSRTLLFGDHSTHFGVRLSVCLSSRSSRTCSRPVKKKEVRLDHRSGGERAPQHKNQIRCLALTAAPTHRLCCSMGEVLLEGRILNRDASYCDNMFLTNCLSSSSLVVRPPLLSSSDQDHN